MKKKNPRLIIYSQAHSHQDYACLAQTLLSALHNHQYILNYFLGIISFFLIKAFLAACVLLGRFHFLSQEYSKKRN